MYYNDTKSNITGETFKEKSDCSEYRRNHDAQNGIGTTKTYFTLFSKMTHIFNVPVNELIRSLSKHKRRYPE